MSNSASFSSFVKALLDNVLKPFGISFYASLDINTRKSVSLYIEVLEHREFPRHEYLKFSKSARCCCQCCEH